MNCIKKKSSCDSFVMADNENDRNEMIKSSEIYPLNYYLIEIDFITFPTSRYIISQSLTFWH